MIRKVVKKEVKRNVDQDRMGLGGARNAIGSLMIPQGREDLYIFLLKTGRIN